MAATSPWGAHPGAAANGFGGGGGIGTAGEGSFAALLRQSAQAVPPAADGQPAILYPFPLVHEGGHWPGA